MATLQVCRKLVLVARERAKVMRKSECRSDEFKKQNTEFRTEESEESGFFILNPEF